MDFEVVGMDFVDCEMVATEVVLGVAEDGLVFAVSD